LIAYSPPSWQLSIGIRAVLSEKEPNHLRTGEIQEVPQKFDEEGNPSPLNRTVTRERSLTKATRKTRNILRRSLIVKLMLAKNGTQVMRVSSQKVMKWQP
jgi:hypothetical protein